jgi:LuxR family maltose regulon positive regulatory protein
MIPTVTLTPKLKASFQAAYSKYQILLFSAPCGFGKTVLVHALLPESQTAFFNAAEMPFAPVIGKKIKNVVIDDLQNLKAPDGADSVCRMIRENPAKKFLLLSRGTEPGWLMPFSFTGKSKVFGMSELLMDRSALRLMLDQNGIQIDEATLSTIDHDCDGYPLALALTSRYLASGKSYTPIAFEQVKREVFLYLEESVFRPFTLSQRRLLLSVAPFENFTVEMASSVSGDSEAGMILDNLSRETSFLLFDKVNVYRIRPLFREFLIWETERTYSQTEKQEFLKRAGLYYELHGDISHALDCYSKGGESCKVSELLEKHALLHPGIGHYYETEQYYRSLAKEQVLSSPSLMCGMSILCAMTSGFEQSEEWYRALRDYATALKHSDTEYREVYAKLYYLDIALPQRGIHNMTDLILDLFKASSKRKLMLPAMSVTSTLPSLMNGGKDFCEWSKQDELLYHTMRKPVEAILGRDGVGIADCAICESKFEKGDDISGRLLNLISRLGEIQNRGTPDIEFAVIGLLARNRVERGEVSSAKQAVLSLRERFLQSGEERFLPNIDSLLCRIALLTGDTEQVIRWMHEKAPTDTLRLHAMWRYQYLTLAMAHLAMGENTEVLYCLAPLLPYCEKCERNMDLIYIRTLSAIAHYRLNDTAWKKEWCAALDSCCNYRFITPTSQFGAAVLPLLQSGAWKREKAFVSRLTEEARKQAIYYPGFLKPAFVVENNLTDTEIIVLRLMCSNKSNQEIADTLGIKLPTVKTHVSHILQKLNVKSRGEAKDTAQQMKLV